MLVLTYLLQQRQRLHKWLYDPHLLQYILIDTLMLAWIISVLIEVFQWLK